MPSNREHSNPKEENNPSRCKWNGQVSAKSQEAGHVATSKDAWWNEETWRDQIQHNYTWSESNMSTYICRMHPWIIIACNFRQFLWEDNPHMHNTFSIFQSSSSSPVIWYLIQSSMVSRFGRFPPRCNTGFGWFVQAWPWYAMIDAVLMLMCWCCCFKNWIGFSKCLAHVNELAKSSKYMEMCCDFLSLDLWDTMGC